MAENGSVLNVSQLKEKNNLNVNFLNYFSLVHAIPQKWKRDVKTVDKELNDNTFQSELIMKLMKTKKCCKLVHEMSIEHIFETPVCELKWAIYFEEWDLNWTDICSSPLIIFIYVHQATVFSIQD